ncbi:MAG: AAA family ATPase, partial [Candidatus Aminicenantes bacterium]|nr:AAA family ATPase [Candidatus Aminicenantes bacterium]
MNLKRKTNFPSLPAEKLRWRCPLEKIPFETTLDCSPCDEIIGQDRAIKAIQTGLEVKSIGYNIFITGMVGTGRTTAIKQLLEKLEKMEKDQVIPPDLLYVNNFSHPDEPVLLHLPAGQGRRFKQAMANLIEMLSINIPELLKSHYYTERKEVIIENQQRKQKEILERFESQVAEEGFSVIQVQMGLFVKPDLVPLIEGRPVSFSKLEALVREKKFPPEELERLKNRYEALSAELEKIFERLREIEEETRTLLKNWDAEAITPIISGAINEIRSRFPYSGVDDYLVEVEKSLIANLDLFKEQKKEDKEKDFSESFLPYRVNLLVDNAELKTAPVIIETNPTYNNLFGSIEVSLTRSGLWQTDFTKIKAGSFLKANGGYLVMNALDALIEPGVWTTLKRSLKNQQLEIQNYPPLFLISTARLKPQPVPCQVKVVLIGDAPLYDLLYYLDEDFKKIFKVKAEFDSEMLKTDKAIIDYARFIRKICDEDKLLPFDREGIAAIIEFGVRLAGRQKKMSTRFHILADVIREADFWARKEGASLVTRHHVEKSIDERFERLSLIEDKIQELIEDGLLLIDTQGEAIGQVNGLSVYQLGEFAFGKPTRITARTAVGRGGVINIEREAALGGAVYIK